MNFSLDAVLERKGASMPRRTIVRELCKTTFVTNVDEHMDRVVASNFHDKRYSHYGEIKARDPRTGNTSVLEAFIALSLESIAHKKPWYGEVSKDTIIRSNKYFKQVAKARLEDKVDLIHYNIVNAFANKLMVIDMGNFWPQSVATNPEVPITPSTVTNEEGLINNALAELALHCAKKTKELPWVQGSEDVSVIAQTEFLLYCYFVLDVTCYMKKAAVSTRRELTRLIEEYLEKNITKLGDWDQKYSIRELRDHRDKYYTGLFSNDKDWLIKSIECFTSISIESISNGVFFMKSGNVISTNPILTMEAYTMLTEDVINDGDILPIKLIFNSAEKIVKANKPT